ncbi:MAG: hypothetical protein ACLUV5_00665 [Oscillospiraceae bacterium]|jgi:hypothetical protein|nr:MAG TPA: Protein of unknown function (DUF722) [Caudoviricetes sp.]DAY82484.1 MAG TPA: Protein of unknown function (DUF722) [Caudoviricetes sp.]
MNTSNVENLCGEKFFKEMFYAHKKIAEIGERLNKLRISATYISPSFGDSPKSNSNPQKLEATIIDIVSLEEYATQLLKERAKFDLFVSKLGAAESKLLKMRCDEALSWKEIAGELRMSVSSSQRMFLAVCNKAESIGLYKMDA